MSFRFFYCSCSDHENSFGRERGTENKSKAQAKKQGLDKLKPGTWPGFKTAIIYFDESKYIIASCSLRMKLGQMVMLCLQKNFFFLE